MLTKRIIPCLDVKDGRVVKGINFLNLRDAGDPAETAAAYDAQGADEVVFLDITASADSRDTQLSWVRNVASTLFIPFTVGGGIRTTDDFKAILREGADKISVNSAALMNPDLIYDAAMKFGSQLRLMPRNVKALTDGRYIKTAEESIWVSMPLNGPLKQKSLVQVRYFLHQWMLTEPRPDMILN